MSLQKRSVPAPQDELKLKNIDVLEDAPGPLTENTGSADGDDPFEYTASTLTENTGPADGDDPASEIVSEIASSPTGDEFSFVISAERAGERIDRVLADSIPGQSRSYLKKLIKDGCIRIRTPEGTLEPVKKPSRTVSGGENVEVFLPLQMLPEILPENIPLDILYEDEDVLVVNKPKGMVVHPAAGHYTGTLVNAVLYHCGDSLSGINGVLRPGIVHRIDMDTTGSIIVCKNDAAHRSIAAQLAEHSIVRRYRAIILGNIKEDSLTISQPIGRDPSDRKKMAVRPDGKQAITHVRVLERFGDYTYIECRLETGRTHQIRVHLAHAHHPLLGDTAYGSRRKTPFSTQGQCLHAMTLGFVHPGTGQYIETVAPLPEYFETILGRLSASR
ncbi:MAG: RluA family pseudouridine synthase [Eubacteriales bacterium]|nr:RluA family pseudouridine synthase [Eubacteriales bacterium]